MKFPPLEYRRAEDLSSACELLAEEGARPLGGGQSLLPLLAFRMARPSILVDVSRIEELRGCVLGENEHSLTIGAATTHAEVQSDRIVARQLPILARVASHIGHRSIRHLGTIGGSVAHADPAAEWPATCMALGAIAEVSSLGARRRVPVADLIEGPYQARLEEGEMISRLEFPLEPHRRFGMAEVALRPGDFALAGAVCVLEDGRGAVTFFGVEGKPQRIELPSLEHLSVGDGHHPDGLVEEVVGRLEGVLEDVHASASFRRHLAKTALKRALADALQETA